MALTAEQLEQFFITRNEIASRHGSKLEHQAMSRVREHLVEVQSEEAKKAEAKSVEATTKADKKK